MRTRNPVLLTLALLAVVASNASRAQTLDGDTPSPLPVGRLIAAQGNRALAEIRDDLAVSVRDLQLPALAADLQAQPLQLACAAPTPMPSNDHHERC